MCKWRYYKGLSKPENVFILFLYSPGVKYIRIYPGSIEAYVMPIP